MKTFDSFTKHLESVPLSTTWLLADITESRGMQELSTRQSPQVLKALKNFAIIESTVSSNRIEGVEIENDRVRPVIMGKGSIKDRDEEEIRGYKNALIKIFSNPDSFETNKNTICQLHKTIRGKIWDAGKFKEEDSDIIETYPDGRARIRFKTVSSKETPNFINSLIEKMQRILKEKKILPLLAIAAFNLDFLCIHPFRDGNGRVSRLLLVLQLLQEKYEVGRYISLERLIEQNKERYYETLEESSKNWHNGSHDPWPYINYLLYIIKSAYNELEIRAKEVKSPRGSKRTLVLNALSQQEGLFTVNTIQQACPGVGIDMIRKVMKELQKIKKIKCVKAGQNAQWEKTEKIN